MNSKICKESDYINTLKSNTVHVGESFKKLCCPTKNCAELGSLNRPVKSLREAIELVKKKKMNNVSVLIAAGDYSFVDFDLEIPKEICQIIGEGPSVTKIGNNINIVNSLDLQDLTLGTNTHEMVYTVDYGGKESVSSMQKEFKFQMKNIICNGRKDFNIGKGINVECNDFNCTHHAHSSPGKPLKTLIMESDSNIIRKQSGHVEKFTLDSAYLNSNTQQQIRSAYPILCRLKGNAQYISIDSSTDVNVVVVQTPENKLNTLDPVNNIDVLPLSLKYIETNGSTYSRSFSNYKYKCDLNNQFGFATYKSSKKLIIDEEQSTFKGGVGSSYVNKILGSGNFTLNINGRKSFGFLSLDYTGDEFSTSSSLSLKESNALYDMDLLENAKLGSDQTPSAALVSGPITETSGITLDGVTASGTTAFAVTAQSTPSGFMGEMKSRLDGTKQVTISNSRFLSPGTICGDIDTVISFTSSNNIFGNSNSTDKTISKLCNIRTLFSNTILHNSRLNLSGTTEATFDSMRCNRSELHTETQRDNTSDIFHTPKIEFLSSRSVGDNCNFMCCHGTNLKIASSIIENRGNNPLIQFMEEENIKPKKSFLSLLTSEFRNTESMTNPTSACFIDKGSTGCDCIFGTCSVLGFFRLFLENHPSNEKVNMSSSGSSLFTSSSEIINSILTLLDNKPTSL